MTGRNFLKQRVESDLALPNMRVILSIATAIADDDDEADILNQEVLQEGGYASQPYSYTANTAVWNSTINKLVAPDSTATFTADVAGDGFQITQVILWQGRGEISNKLITAVDAGANQIICTAHGLVDGDRAFVKAIGTLPGGLAVQRYWVKRLDNDTIELHSTSALNAAVNILNSGVGEMWLVHANGQMVDKWTYPLITMPPGSEQSFNISMRYS
jgi:hypothetical protein